jgi:hypothetical protein
VVSICGVHHTVSVVATTAAAVLCLIHRFEQTIAVATDFMHDGGGDMVAVWWRYGSGMVAVAVW